LTLSTSYDSLSCATAWFFNTKTRAALLHP
jgi:hypothetical protein